MPGLLAYRELDDALGLSEMAGEVLADARTGKNGRHALVGMLRQSVFGRLAGYEDVNDADRLRHDPAMRWVVGGKAAQGRAASPSQMGRFETNGSRHGESSRSRRSFRKWIDRVHARRPPRGDRARHGFEREPDPWRTGESVWNGHFDCTCYHPLFVFNQFGDLERCAFRPATSTVPTAGRRPEAGRGSLQGQGLRICFRGDAAFAMPRSTSTSSRRDRVRDPLAGQPDIARRIGYLLTRPVGRPPHMSSRCTRPSAIKAGSWRKPRRVVAKVEWHPGELFPRVGFIVTNMTRPPKNVVAFYNKRGTCEQ